MTQLKWQPNEQDAQGVDRVFKGKLKDSAINQFEVKDWGSCTMPFLGVTHKVMHDTTRAVLDGFVEDVVHSNGEEKMSEAALKLWAANWSYGIKRFNFSKDDHRLEPFSDLDCIAIHQAKQKFEQDDTQSAFVHL